MRYYAIYTFILIAIVLVLFSCSHGTTVISPDTKTPIDIKYAAQSNSHNLFGLYTFICDPDKATVDVTPLRNAGMHLNALKFLEPPPLLYLTIESPPQFNGNILDVDIGLRNPYLGYEQFTGFDVCGIVFTHGSESGYADPEIVMAGESDTRLLNADGYTRWWNPAEFPHGDTIFNYIDGMLGTPSDSADFNCTINGYKYFADDLDKDAPLTVLDLSKRGMFSAGKKNTRHYTIDMSGGLIFNYAVDACWMKPQGTPPYDAPDDFPPGANRPEAYNATITEVKNSLYYEESSGFAGGELKLLIDVWDHFNAGLNEVYAESLAGLPLIPALTPIGGGEGYSTYELDLTGEALTHSGDAELLITVQSEASGYGGLLPGKPVCSYFKHAFSIQNPLGWARTWGGTSRDLGYDITADSNGNIYITGLFRGTVDFDPGPGTDNHTTIEDHEDNVFLSKFDSKGQFLWARTWGAGTTWPGEERGGVAVDSSGNIYVTGWFNSTVDFDPGPGIDNHTPINDLDIFLSKFDSDGTFQWARTWETAFTKVAKFDVTTDSFGDIYITGLFAGTVDFNPGPGVDERTANFHDAFLSKFDSGGDFIWVRTWGGINHDQSIGVATDSYDNIYITGIFSETVDFDPGPGVDEHTSNGYMDIFLSKLDSSGTFQWARTWGGEVWQDYGWGIALDEADDVLVTGLFRGTMDFDPGPGTDIHTCGGKEDVFLSKFDSSGNFQWARTWGEGSEDYGYGVAADASNNIYVTGKFALLVDFDPGPGVDEHASDGSSDVFLSKFGPNGDFQWARTWGGSKRDYGYDIAVDTSGIPYITGSFSKTADFDPGPGVDEHISNGSFDPFLIKFQPDGYW